MGRMVQKALSRVLYFWNTLPKQSLTQKYHPRDSRGGSLKEHILFKLNNLISEAVCCWMFSKNFRTTFVGIAEFIIIIFFSFSHILNIFS